MIEGIEIKKTQNEKTMNLKLIGRLDASTSPKLLEVFAETFKDSEKIELDFSDVVYVSSAGLRVLLIGAKNAKSSDKVMEILNASSHIMRVFEVTGFSKILTVK